MGKIKITVLIIILTLVVAGGTSLFVYGKRLKTNKQSSTPSTESTQSSKPASSGSQRPNSQLGSPVENYKSGQTKKAFGQYITPANSPVQPEKFTGYHTGVDVEEPQDNNNVPVLSVADGIVRYTGTNSGYGGVIVIEFDYKGQTYTALYGHLRLASATVSEGDPVKIGQQMAVLGAPNSKETDGERKHLHFGIHKGSSVDLAGYVQNQSDLSAWVDPGSIIN